MTVAGEVIEELVKKYTPNHYKEWEREQKILERIKEFLMGKRWREKGA